MTPPGEPRQQNGNQRVAQVMAVGAAVVGGVVAVAYSVTAAIVVWVLAVVLLIGSFFIERDY
jgi:fatty acid desaturase